MIAEVRSKQQRILVAGNHLKLIQSVLDFDYAAGKEVPSVSAVVTLGRKTQKFFWGDGEVLIPAFPDIAAARKHGSEADFLLNLTSASSTRRMVEQFFSAYPDALGAHLFAENVCERDALALIEHHTKNSDSEKYIAGASGVGLCIPGALKLGAIGGIRGERVASLGATRGKTAVICCSGGMTNEVIYQLTQAGSGVSFAISYGGDRFPITSPLQWALLAERDPQTQAIVFFGEVGGRDEYELADALCDARLTKPLYAYVAGMHANTDSGMQFGHAKAFAKQSEETAHAKQKALAQAGAVCAQTYAKFVTSFKELPKGTSPMPGARAWLGHRETAKPTRFSSPRPRDLASAHSFAEAILKRLLGRDSISPDLTACADLIFRELIEHGPQVSGAVNTMVTARAGKDMAASLAAGVLTVGERFGGAINAAAHAWHRSVAQEVSPEAFVEDASIKREYIAGIGHRHYSVYTPDPRVAKLLLFADEHLAQARHTQFARAVAARTSKKRANLILNIDGAVASLMLDLLVEKEGYEAAAIENLLASEFFNALFLIPRSVGFVGHFLDQKRIDEGLFRLGEDDVHLF